MRAMLNPQSIILDFWGRPFGEMIIGLGVTGESIVEGKIPL